MSESKQQHFISLMRDFRHAMFTTHHGSEFHSRPMTIAEVDEPGNVWLLSDSQSGKIEELVRDARVGISMQDGLKFVAMTGDAEIVRDRQKIHKLWNEAWKVWFPEGADDPGLVLIKVKPARGEYWDNSGTNAVKYLYEAAKAYIQGKRPDVGDAQSKVVLPT